MFKKTISTILLLLVALFAFSQSALKRKTTWTVTETKEWAAKNRDYPTWHGLLLYQGSDTSTHHFISRCMDEWVWFNLKRTDVAIKDERQYQTTSSTHLGYYYVDATKDFNKVEE